MKTVYPLQTKFAGGITKFTILGSMLCLLVMFDDSLGKEFGPRSGPKVIKLFSCSTQLSIKIQLLIKT